MDNICLNLLQSEIAQKPTSNNALYINEVN